MTSAAVVPPVSVEREDKARAAVPVTAIGVAALRAFESRKPPEERLIYDPLAELFVVDAVVDKFLKTANKPQDFWIDFLATRTRWIDDKICSEAESTPDLQLVIVGAGLDTRAYRLEALRGKQVFEVDFAEVLEAKHAILSEGSVKAEPLARRATVSTDLSISSEWQAALLAAGYSREKRSLWLLEGLTGYLTEEELNPLLKDISGLSLEGSRMLATFVGDGMRVANDATHMHRYYVKDEAQPSELLRAHGWETSTVMSIRAIADLYKRSEHIPPEYSYFIADALRVQSVAPSRI